MATSRFVTLLVQAAGALLVALIFRSFHQHYDKRYLRHWTLSWFAAVVKLLGAAGGLAYGGTLPADDAWRVSSTAIGAVAGYYQVAWLIFGTYELATGRRISRRFARRLFSVLTVAGVLSAVLFVWDPEAGGARYFVRVGIRSFVGGVAFVAAARGVWRARAAFGGLGTRIVAGSFVLYGLEQFQYFGVGVGTLVTNEPVPQFTAYTNLVDFILQFAMALGMVIWLLEDERRRAMEAVSQMEHLAYHDALTGLPNRQLLLDRLSQAVASAHRAGHRLAVFFLDVDRFKLINDSLGHSSGDELLRVVARRLRDALREEDTVARIGGDEFAVLTPHLAQLDDAITVARKLRDAVRQPVALAGSEGSPREIFVSTSVGIAIYPNDGADGEALLKNADTAMYLAKQQGRDSFQIYAPAMNAQALQQLALESRLRKAQGNGELEVFFQTINDTRSGRVAALEAVLRWRHPERGLLYPDEFIALAETTGIIVPVGEWVLRTTCRELRRWQQLGHPELRVAVNLSVRQLQQADFVETVSQILRETGVPPRTLELEITESIAMQSDEAALAKLRELKRLGVRISIDDFGTGYSSLSLLRLFPADALKIDRSFVRDLAHDENDAAIAASVIALAHTLRLHVIAEGVESDEQLRFLAARGCDFWQGYLRGEPVPALQCDELLRHERATMGKGERRASVG